MRIFILRNSRLTLIPFLLFPVLLLCIFISPSKANTPIYPARDSSRQIVIHSIRIQGNKQTKSSVILRELSFHESDTLPVSTFVQQITAGRENIFNTSLFNFVTVDIDTVEKAPELRDVVIHVVERWYVWPWPFFEISDRNFNTWVETTDLSRLTYGIDLTVLNLRGRNETLKFPVHLGFNQKFGFSYRLPYFDRHKIAGIAFGAEYNRNHEVIAATDNNKTVYYKDPVTYPRQNFYGFMEFLLRPSFYAHHTFRVGYNAWLFSDSLLNIPGYATGKSNHLNYVSLYYQYKNDHRDVQFYPLKGYYFDVEIDQNGFPSSDVNEFYFKTNFRKYMQINWHSYFASGITLKASLTPQPPYFMQRGLGYGREYVRGYEYYVIDGRDFILWKNNIKFALIPDRNLDIGFIRSQKFNKIPFALYFNLFCDAGYVIYDGEFTDPSNNLRNSWLFGYGMGLDLVTYYDIVIRLEATMNLKDQFGVYLHFTAPI